MATELNRKQKKEMLVKLLKAKIKFAKDDLKELNTRTRAIKDNPLYFQLFSCIGCGESTPMDIANDLGKARNSVLQQFEKAKEEGWLIENPKVFQHNKKKHYINKKKLNEEFYYFMKVGCAGSDGFNANWFNKNKERIVNSKILSYFLLRFMEELRKEEQEEGKSLLTLFHFIMETGFNAIDDFVNVSWRKEIDDSGDIFNELQTKSRYINYDYENNVNITAKLVEEIKDHLETITKLKKKTLKEK